MLILTNAMRFALELCTFVLITHPMPLSYSSVPRFLPLPKPDNRKVLYTVAALPCNLPVQERGHLYARVISVGLVPQSLQKHAQYTSSSVD
jgi:hypothetical protein